MATDTDLVQQYSFYKTNANAAQIEGTPHKEADSSSRIQVAANANLASKSGTLAERQRSDSEGEGATRSIQFFTGFHKLAAPVF